MRKMLNVNIVLFLKKEYTNLVEKKFKGEFVQALQNFNTITENELRKRLNSFYKNSRSRDQAWKGYKGMLYEFAVFESIKQVIASEKELSLQIDVISGSNISKEYRDQVFIKNWVDILPDVDIVIIQKLRKIVKAIVSCKTSLRERLTETAFWKRELERNDKTRNIKVILVTTDKDEELRIDTNRYILLHVIDYTLVTDMEKYRKLIRIYQEKYGNRRDFNELISKVKPITCLKEVLYDLIDSKN